MTKPTVLVTGGAGYIGSHAVLALKDAGWRVAVIDDRSNGAPERVPIGEDDPKLPINPYGASKLMTERMLEDAAAAHPFNYGALRYFNVAGADPEGRSGQVGKGSTHLIKIACEAAVGRRDHVAVYGEDYPTPDGTCIRDYVHVSDLAPAHVAPLDWLVSHPDEHR